MSFHMNKNRMIRKDRRPARAGFTLAELVAALAMATLLAALALSARAGAKDQNLVGECAGNLRQFALALQLFGNENNDALPSNSGGMFVNWTWDMNANSGNAIAQYVSPGVGSTNLSWRVFYCPGTGYRFTAQDNNNLWNYIPGQMRVLGYLPAIPGMTGMYSTNVNSTLTPQPGGIGINATPAVSASRRVLVADATISYPAQYNPSLKAIYNWTSIRGGYPVAHTSPHLAGQLPAGGNVAMLDGHVEWRSFSQMTPRASGSSAPVFWW